jgi:hypothetical protein
MLVLVIVFNKSLFVYLYCNSEMYGITYVTYFTPAQGNVLIIRSLLDFVNRPVVRAEHFENWICVRPPRVRSTHSSGAS